VSEKSEAGDPYLYLLTNNYVKKAVHIDRLLLHPLLYIITNVIYWPDSNPCSRQVYQQTDGKALPLPRRKQHRLF
jgi:hypothetical protein